MLNIFYLILIVSGIVISSDIEEQLVASETQTSCVSDSMWVKCEPNLSETILHDNEKLKCLEKIYFDEIATPLSINQTRNITGLIAYWFNSNSSHAHYERGFNMTFSSVHDLNLNISSNLTVLQHQFDRLDSDVKLFKSLLETASKNLKSIKKQIKQLAKHNEAASEKEEKKKNESSEEDDDKKHKKKKKDKKEKKNKSDK